MNLRDLKYIVAIADFGNFSKAAIACHISQPALSMQVKKLEESIGSAIFERSRKQFMVTPTGEKLIAKAREILRAVDEFHETANIGADLYSGRVTIAAFPTLAPYYFPKVIKKIAARFPGLKLFLVEDKTAEIINKLTTGEVDVAFLALPVEGENFEIIPLFDDEFVVAVNYTHKFARKKTISRDDLKTEKLLLLEEGHCLRNQALEFCELLGSGEVQDFRATSLETLRQMVAAGNGITLMPEIARRDDDSLKYIKFDTAPPSRRIAMVWRKSNPRAKVFAEIAELVK